MHRVASVLRQSVLVIDDVKRDRERIASLIESIPNIEILSLEDKDSVLRVARSLRVDVALVDIVFKGQEYDGFGIVEELRQLSRTCQFAIITSAPTAENRRKAELLGVKHFVSKPAQKEQLSAVLKELLADARSALENQFSSFEKWDYPRDAPPVRRIYIPGVWSGPTVDLMSSSLRDLAQNTISGLCVDMHGVTDITVSAAKALMELVADEAVDRLMDRTVLASLPPGIQGQLEQYGLGKTFLTLGNVRESLSHLGADLRSLPTVRAGAKLAVIGPGQVGSAVAFELARSGTASEIALIGRTSVSGLGERYDLWDCASAMPELLRVTSGTYEVAAGSDIVIVCAGEQVGGTHDRSAVLAPNAEKMTQEILPNLRKYVFDSNKDAKLVIVDNPVDVITYVCHRWCQREQCLTDASTQVIGTGTLVDTLRYKSRLMAETNMPAERIEGMVLGEHGIHAVPILSKTRIAGQKLEHHPKTRHLRRTDITSDLIQAAKMVKESKQLRKRADYRPTNPDTGQPTAATIEHDLTHTGGTRWIVAMAVRLLVESLLSDVETILPVTTYLKEFDSVGPLCMSVPCRIGRNGIYAHQTSSYADDFEKQDLVEAAKAIVASIESIGY